jgi:selenocysteine-specific elongation factor
MADSRPQLVVGTAGHIDHGKSRLVYALTGSDPDRLPEEKSRGMTIELGFAYAEIAAGTSDVHRDKARYGAPAGGDKAGDPSCDVWFVDVPGHERFIRSMVSGATGIDLPMLVVAADDSVMPQTREHAEVLRLLGLERCLVVLTKMDLVDDKWAEAVEQEIGELLAGLGIEPIRFVRTSAETGAGLDELRAALRECARNKPVPRAAYDWFRLPIDRAFTITGRGTVVTGSVMHGAIRADDELELWPSGLRVRGRDLQTHHEGRAGAAGRMRLAVNLAGVPLSSVSRGDELATVGYLETTQCLDVRLDRLRAPGKALRKHMRVRLHLATTEVRAELQLAGPVSGATVDGAVAQLRLGSPIVSAWGQRFIIRDDSGSRTLGGGVVLRPRARPWRAKRPAHAAGLEILHTGKPKQRMLEVIRDQEWPAASISKLATRAGLASAPEANAVVRKLCVEDCVVALNGDAAEGLVHREVLRSAAKHVVARVARQSEENARWPGVATREWSGWMPRACPGKLRAALADWIIKQGDLVLSNGFVLPKDHAASMSDHDQTLYSAVLQEIDHGAFQPPAVETLSCRTPKNAKRVDELIELAIARGELRRLADGVWLHQRRWDELIATVRRLLDEHGPFTISQLRVALDSSRKFVVPLAEALDAAGITKRMGDKRAGGPKLSNEGEALAAS